MGVQQCSVSQELNQFFDSAYLFCQKYFDKEVSTVENRRFSEQTPESFLRQYVFVVLNSGMKNAVAERIFERFMANLDLNVIRHLGKKKAIETALSNYQAWFKEITKVDNKLAYLGLLPWIGSVTKYHLARNLGLDFAKPDRHLIRLAEKYSYGSDVLRMCRDLAELKGLRIGTVDVVLWRYLACGCPQI